MAADGAALLAAAVRAAVLAKAPRRTVQAVAAAVTGVLAAPARSSGAGQVSQRTAELSDAGAGSPESLLAALREARTARRNRKKERKRAAKVAAAAAAPGKDALTRGPELDEPALTEAALAKHDDAASPAASPAPTSSWDGQSMVPPTPCGQLAHEDAESPRRGSSVEPPQLHGQDQREAAAATPSATMPPPQLADGSWRVAQSRRARTTGKGPYKRHGR